MFSPTPHHEISMTKEDLVNAEKRLDKRNRKDRGGGIGDDTESDWSDETPYEVDHDAAGGESAYFEDMSAFYNRVVENRAGSSSHVKIEALRQRFRRLLNAVHLPGQAVKILKDLMGAVQMRMLEAHFHSDDGRSSADRHDQPKILHSSITVDSARRYNLIFKIRGARCVYEQVTYGDPNMQVFDAAEQPQTMVEVPNIKARLLVLSDVTALVAVKNEGLTQLRVIKLICRPTVLACPGASVWQLLGVISSDPLTQGFQHILPFHLANVVYRVDPPAIDADPSVEFLGMSEGRFLLMKRRPRYRLPPPSLRRSS
ncbi:hypothetical protein FOZ63_023729 [Perkinsus olseni]|uniref:Uncharacterized protein n=1 Tax=Perkinsus olseni TaxID=32597 RepID=A0A7J6N501_PEROL|nr:hypothetical protein FOZ63_023729 [Perkinsus olseni]KAF4708507.1 hypothetical protein FOZ62_003872 [Perkinsus olseni]